MNPGREEEILAVYVIANLNILHEQYDDVYVKGCCPECCAPCNVTKELYDDGLLMFYIKLAPDHLKEFWVNEIDLDDFLSKAWHCTSKPRCEEDGLQSNV